MGKMGYIHSYFKDHERLVERQVIELAEKANDNCIWTKWDYRLLVITTVPLQKSFKEHGLNHEESQLVIDNIAMLVKDYREVAYKNA